MKLKREEKQLLKQKHKQNADFKIKNLELLTHENHKKPVYVMD